MQMQRGLVVTVVIILSGLLTAWPVVEATAVGSPRSSAATARAKQRQERRAKQERRRDGQRQATSRRGQRRGTAAAQGAQRDRSRPVPLPGGYLRTADARQARAPSQGERYIVRFESERVDSLALATALGRQPGVAPFHVYEHVFNGFAAELTPAARRALARDPSVASVTRDRQFFLAGANASAQPAPVVPAQPPPAGVDRIDGELNPVADIDGGGPGVDVDIAIIDTGTDLGHPDLNVFAYVDCASTPDTPNWGRDLDGHGTHVAGTAAAIDNDIGVVGVAPGARIWSMRVMGDSGYVFAGDVIACMDLVVEYATTPVNGETIDVVNISLGSPSSPNDDDCTDGAFNRAVCAMVNAGVTTVVAAGNESQDAGNLKPANIDEVITVSALADSDGRPGGQGGSFNPVCQLIQVDDHLATFSNFGPDIDIAAPGVDIESTYPRYLETFCQSPLGDGYAILPGTSMASPHVAGAAGLILAAAPSLSPAQVRTVLLAAREDVAMPGDPDEIDEGILNVAPRGLAPGPGDTTKPRVTIQAPKRSRVKRKFPIRVRASDASGIARVQLFRCERGCRRVAQDATAPYRFVRRHNQPGRVRYRVRVIDRAGNFNWTSTVITIRPAPRR